jgi:hypothetical protein
MWPVSGVGDVYAAQFCLEGEGVGVVEVDVVVLGGCQVRSVFGGDGVALGAQGVERVAEVGGSPQDGGVCGQGQAQSLIDLVVEVSASDVALVGEKRSRRRACRLPLFRPCWLTCLCIVPVRVTNALKGFRVRLQAEPVFVQQSADRVRPHLVPGRGQLIGQVAGRQRRPAQR